MRSFGSAARVNELGQHELLGRDGWQAAPLPLMTFLPFAALPSEHSEPLPPNNP